MIVDSRQIHAGFICDLPEGGAGKPMITEQQLGSVENAISSGLCVHRSMQTYD